LLDVARTGQTTHPLLIDISLARQMNKHALTHIGWWEVGKFDQMTLDFFSALNNQLPIMQSSIAHIEKSKNEYRNLFKRRH